MNNFDLMLHLSIVIGCLYLVLFLFFLLHVVDVMAFWLIYIDWLLIKFVLAGI